MSENKFSLGKIFGNSSKTNKSDLVAKILSIVAAILLWFYVIDVQTTQHEKEFYAVPVAIENFSGENGLDIISGRNSTIDVTLRGTKAQINALTLSDINAVIDLSDIYETGEFPLEVSVSVPSGVSVVSKSISSVMVSIDRTVGRSVPVDKDLSFMLPDSYELGDISLSPMSVYIEGPQDLVDSVEKGVVKLDLGTVNNKVTARSDIILLDKNGNAVVSPYIRKKETSAEITIPVIRTLKKKIELNDISEGIEYECTVSPSEIMVKGNAATVEAIGSVMTEPFEVTKSGVLSVRLSLPSDVTAYDASGNVIAGVAVTVKNVREIEKPEEVQDDESKANSSDDNDKEHNKREGRDGGNK